MRVVSWDAGVWWVSWMSSWRRRGSEERSPQFPEHDPEPFLINPGLFLFFRDLDELA